MGEKCRTWFHALREYAQRIKAREGIEQAGIQALNMQQRS